MPFNDISCHVWAIAGYYDDDTAAAVNTAYTNSIQSPGTVANNKGARTAALRHIITSVRASQNSVITTDPCIIYGGFRRGQSGPEHMWLEYDGTIYETMPGYRIYVETATNASRVNPQLENNHFDPVHVGVVNSFLTDDQRSMIDDYHMLLESGDMDLVEDDEGV